MIEYTRTASAVILFDLPDITVSDYVYLITHSFTINVLQITKS
jgi:hypothetical protein